MGYIEKLKAKVEISETGCWLWKGVLDRKGYGRTRLFRSRKTTGAHRAMYEATLGKIPDGLYLLHKCDVPNCVNPDHLYPGTQKQNIQDAKQRNRLNPAKGAKAGRAVLTEEQVRFIRENSKPYSREWGRAALAKRFGVAASTVSELISKNNWSHVE